MKYENMKTEDQYSMNRDGYNEEETYEYVSKSPIVMQAINL